MILKSIISLLLASTTCLSAGLYGPYVVREQRSQALSSWKQTKRAVTTELLPMRFALKQSNLHELDSRLMDVAHPDSSNYGRHYTARDIKKAFAPTDATENSVLTWLHGSGYSGAAVSPGGNWVDLTLTVSQAEELLQTTYFQYEHDDGTKQTGCDAYSLPSGIVEHLDFVTPTIHMHSAAPLPRPRKRESLVHKFDHLRRRDMYLNINSSDLSNCSLNMTPACVKALYNIEYTPVATANNSFGIAEFGDQSFVQSDIDLFAAMNNLSGPSLVPNVTFINGGSVMNTPANDTVNGEPDLDLQFAMALTVPQEIQLLQVGGNSLLDLFDGLLEGLDASYCIDGINTTTINQTCGVVKPPNVISVSYSLEEWVFPVSYLQRQCAEFAKLGLMGVSVLFATGDRGAAGHASEECLVSSDIFPRGVPTANGTMFNPNWPAACPYVTAVGGTMLLNGSSIHDPEQAWNLGNFVNDGAPVTLPAGFGNANTATGGGFSNVFAAPSWQKDAVDAYVRNVSAEFDGIASFNTNSMRGYPDISAGASQYAVVVDGALTPTDGTSASTPVIASMLVLINDARIAAGKSPVGFINPVLYSSDFSEVFDDITLGNIRGCNSSFSGGGFPATQGWDAATGLGTPNFEKLLAKFLALP